MDLQQLANQLRCPTGEKGKEVGLLMNKGNGNITKWATQAAAFTVHDCVLEIGMGNGAFVKDILDIHPTIRYFGIDYSSIMVEEARRLNKRHIKEDRANFIEANAKALPFNDHFFTKILSVNTIYFWEDPHEVLPELNRVLGPGGKIVFAMRTKGTMEQMPFTEYGFTKYTLPELAQLLGKYFNIIKSVEKAEPPYLFNNRQMVLENAIVVCEKR